MASRDMVRAQYERRMRGILARKEKEQTKQDEADLAVWRKKQADIERMNMLAAQVGMAKNLKDLYYYIPEKKMHETYFNEELELQLPKYEMKKGAGWDAYLPGGEEFDPKGALIKDVKKFFKPVQERKEYSAYMEGAELRLKEKAAKEIEFMQEAPSGEEGALVTAEEGYGYRDVPAEQLRDIDKAAKLTQYNLTKTRVQELTNILEREGVVLPEEITEDQTLELLSKFDKVPMDKNPVGALGKDQPEYREFIDRLKEGPDAITEIVEEVSIEPFPDLIPEDVPVDAGFEPTAGQLRMARGISDFDPDQDSFEGFGEEGYEDMPEFIKTLPRKTGGAGAMPDMEAPTVEVPDAVAEAPAVEVPDAKPDIVGTVGKTIETASTAHQIYSAGEILASEDATDEQKVVAGTQASKILADVASKHAVKEGGKEALEKGVGLAAKGVGKAAGGVLGAYTAVAGAKAAGEAWEEKDYDEAILHGMSSASGAASAIGAALAFTPLAPLGATMFALGQAGSLISGLGLGLEGIFGGSDEAAAAETPKQMFDVSRYLDTINPRRRELRRRYY